MLVLAIVLQVAAPVAAPTPAPAAPAATSIAAPLTPEKKVCRSQPIPNSRLGGKRICHTRAEWQAIDNAGRASLEQDIKAPSR